MILIEDARIEVSHWQDKDDKRVYKTQLVVEKVAFMGGKKKVEDTTEADNELAEREGFALPETYDETDGLPF